MSRLEALIIGVAFLLVCIVILGLVTLVVVTSA